MLRNDFKVVVRRPAYWPWGALEAFIPYLIMSLISVIHETLIFVILKSNKYTFPSYFTHHFIFLITETNISWLYIVPSIRVSMCIFKMDNEYYASGHFLTSMSRDIMQYKLQTLVVPWVERGHVTISSSPTHLPM